MRGHIDNVLVHLDLKKLGQYVEKVQNISDLYDAPGFK